MPVISPQIANMKDWRTRFINTVADLLPQGNMPAPPLGMQVTEPATWQGMGQRALDMAVPQPEDTLFGVAIHPLQREAEAYLQNVDRIKKLTKKQKGSEYVSDIKWLGDTDTLLRNTFIKEKQPGELFGDYLYRVSGINDIKPKNVPFAIDYPNIFKK